MPEHTHCYKIIFCIDSVLFSDLFLDWNTNILQMYARKCSEYLDEKTHKINIYKIQNDNSHSYREYFKQIFTLPLIDTVPPI